MKRLVSFSIIAVLLSISFFSSSMAAEHEQQPRQTTEDRVEDLLAQMTLDEKIGQMTLVEKNSIGAAEVTAYHIGAVLSGGGGYPRTGNTPENWRDMVQGYQDAALATRLDIPLLYGVDAVHGHNNVKGAMIFPHNIGLGAANDADLMMRIGQATASEMIATGIYWNYAPVLAVPQDIRWGRTYEAFAQDTGIVSSLAAAYLVGLQGNDLADPSTVLGTPKHFVGDGGTVWGTGSSGYTIDQGDTKVDEETLRAIHLPPYQAAIDAGAQSIMVSFSSWNGTKMHGNAYLITDVLKNELGFEGFVVSDWGGIDQIDRDYYTAVVSAINAGVDMNMVPYHYVRFIETMKQAVENGDITEERIDDAVRRILTVKFSLGLFENPYGHDELLDTVGSDAHRELAREAVQKSLVLLKNDDVLPLASDTPVIFVAGRAGDNVGLQCGGWTIEHQGGSGSITPGTTILEAIEQTVSGEVTVIYDRSGNFSDVVGDDGKPATADVGIVVVGEQPYAEGRGDNWEPALIWDDLKAIERTAEQSEKLVVVLLSGRPLIITNEVDNWDALVAAWLPGTEGQGVVDGLFGLSPINGKLSFEWPASLAQVPLGMSDDAPLFPLGYGLETETTATTASTLLLTDFENGIGYMPDEYGNNVNFAPWGDVPDNILLETIAADGDLALPDQDDGNTVLSISYDIASYGGFTHVLTDGESWIPQDWTSHSAFDFWLYGTNSGGEIRVEIFDNRAPGSTGDTAERWHYRLTDDFTGWQFFSIPFVDFQRRMDWQPDGAPADELGLIEVHGYAFAFPAGVGAQTNYLDNVMLSGPPNETIAQATPKPAVETPPDNETIIANYNFDGEWEMVWSDEFDAEANTPLNPEFWSCEVGGGWGNAELQYYTERIENVAHNGEGQLTITAREEDYKGSNYTSARCITMDKVELMFGKIEARMKLPEGQGIWPAFWMLGADFPEIDWPNSGELDIMEYIGKEPHSVYGTIHGSGYPASGFGMRYILDEPVADDYHVFGIEWEPDVIRWYIDDETFYTATPDTLQGMGDWVFNQAFFLLMNVAVGGSWPGNPDDTTVFPQQMLIDWIRVYQRG